MSSGLEAIVSELRRLQKEAIDHVFVEDSTMRLLAPTREDSSDAVKGAPIERERAGSKIAETSRPHTSNEAVDLKALVKEAADEPTTTEPRHTPASNSKLNSQATSKLPTPPIIELPEGDALSRLAWLREKLLSCETCQGQLSEQGQIVFGSGSAEADILFCGEAPGTDEELRGEPFVGTAGQLLTKIITAMGLTRECVYLTNILKWRPRHNKPYGNRPPRMDEMQFCLPYLRAQIEIIQPKVVVALGNTAVTGLLGSDPNRKMGTVRGTWASFADIPLMITFHPSYLLRNGTLKTKRAAWEDMLQVMAKCNIDISEKQRGFFLPKN
jgi:DNA polymerase